MVSLGQAHETELTLTKAGAPEEFWTRLAQNLELARATVAFVMSSVFRLIAKIDRDMTSWKCVEPVEAEEGEFESVLQEFLQREDNGCLSGEAMIKRAEEKGISAGLRHAEAMLRNQERISVEWREYHLLFPEVWQSPRGLRCVFCLYWDGGRWFLRSYCLDDVFSSGYRLVAPRKYLQILGLSES
jgi:hypothetical protein